jgi:hypothetical protein
MPSPKDLTPEDWKKIISIPEVIDAWKPGDETNAMASFIPRVHVAKFFHRTFFPRTDWTLYLLSDGTADGITMVIRETANGFTIAR